MPQDIQDRKWGYPLMRQVSACLRISRLLESPYGIMSLVVEHFHLSPDPGSQGDESLHLPSRGRLGIQIWDGWVRHDVGNPGAANRFRFRWDSETLTMSVDFHPQTCDVAALFGVGWWDSLRGELRHIWPIWREDDSIYFVSYPDCKADGTFDFPSFAHLHRIAERFVELANAAH